MSSSKRSTNGKGHGRHSLTSPQQSLLTTAPKKLSLTPTNAGSKEKDAKKTPEKKELVKDGNSPQGLSVSDARFNVEKLCDAFLEASKAQKETKEIESHLNELRKAILFQGLEDKQMSKSGGLSLRGKIWKVMLALDQIDAKQYIELISKKKSSLYGRIRDDSFRTFTSDAEYQETVKEVVLVRTLNSFVWLNEPNFTYCQGMNTICAPFLYCMPEVDAFYAFNKFITKKFPLYWISAHIGVHAGCMLVDKCLSIVDPELCAYLTKKNHLHSAYVYAFPCVSSLSASVPPFKEVLKLWDFLIAFGPHLNILCVVAQIVSIRNQLFKTEQPGEMLNYRKWPPLRARYIISVAMSLLPQIPNDLYEKIMNHGTDPKVVTELTGRAVVDSIHKNSNPQTQSGPNLAIAAAAAVGAAMAGGDGVGVATAVAWANSSSPPASPSDGVDKTIDGTQDATALPSSDL